MDKFVLEVCIDSVESAIEGVKGGATRLELCQNLIIGGTTPSIALFHQVRKAVCIPANVLIRPRFGDFCYTDYEFAVIEEEIKMFRDAGANGVVVGCLTAEGEIHEKRLQTMKKAAGNMEITLHRCFDMCADPFKALEMMNAYGINTILTSGQKNSALEGIELLKELDEKSGQVDIMAGSGINAAAIKELLDKTNITSYHMSGKMNIDSEMKYRKEDVSMGLKEISEYTIWRTDSTAVAQARNVLEEHLRQV